MTALVVRPFKTIAKLNKNDAVDGVYAAIALLSRRGHSMDQRVPDRACPLVRLIHGARHRGHYRDRVAVMILPALICVLLLGGFVAWFSERWSPVAPRWVGDHYSDC